MSNRSGRVWYKAENKAPGERPRGEIRKHPPVSSILEGTSQVCRIPQQRSSSLYTFRLSVDITLGFIPACANSLRFSATALQSEANSASEELTKPSRLLSLRAFR